ncbi:MAG: hypothetical protein K0M50_17610 [Prolixibacteraceae bacterium]|nr:hypothetical protein [Prolixibacteraceae bacterium]
MIGDIIVFWTVVKDVHSFLSGRADNKKENTIEAHKAINTAFIKTYDYLRNKKGEYVPNPELAEVWNNASSAVMKIDKDMGTTLYYKSRFWLDPDLYFNLNRADEIIELNQVVSEMEKLRMKL